MRHLHSATPDLILHGFVFSLICILGTIGNVLNIIVFSHHRMRSSLSCFLIGLAISQIIILALHFYMDSLPVVADAFGMNDSKYLVLAYIEAYHVFIFNIATLSQVLLMIVISIKCYMMVVHPVLIIRSNRYNSYFTLTRSFLIQLGILAVSIIVSLPCAFTADVQIRPTRVDYLVVAPTNFGFSWAYLILETILYPIIFYLIPIIIISVLGIKIKLELQHISKHSQIEMTESRQDEVEMSKMLIWVIYFFVITTIPIILNCIVYILSDIFEIDGVSLGKMVKFTEPLSTLCTVIISSINFIIYIKEGSKFSQVFNYDIFTCCDGVRGRRSSGGIQHVIPKMEQRDDNTMM